jgi:hypothetical protein
MTVGNDVHLLCYKSVKVHDSLITLIFYGYYITWGVFREAIPVIFVTYSNHTLTITYMGFVGYKNYAACTEAIFNIYMPVNHKSFGTVSYNQLS